MSAPQAGFDQVYEASRGVGPHAVKLLYGGILQLPPVPASASLLALSAKQSYEHRQGQKLFLDMEYILDFAQMQRFDNPLLVDV